MSLLIKCSQKNHVVKRVRLHSGTSLFGSARSCDVVLPELSAFEFVVSYAENWKLNLLTDEFGQQNCGPNIERGQREIPLTTNSKIKTKNYEFSFELIDDKEPLFTAARIETGGNHYWAVKKNGYLLNIATPEQIKKMNLTELTPHQMENEEKILIGDYEFCKVQYRGKTKLNSWARPNRDQMNILLTTAAITCIAVFASWLIVDNKPADLEEYAINLPKPVKRLKPPKKTQAANQKPTMASKNNQSGKTSNSQVKTSRLSRLMGKVAKRVSKKGIAVKRRGIDADNLSSATTSASLLKGANINKIESRFKGIKTRGLAGGGDINGYKNIDSSTIGQADIQIMKEETEVVGGLERDVIARFIKQRLGQILYCYERQLSAKPDLYGKVHVNFEIGANGSVNYQKIKETTMANRLVENCILSKISSWNFPKPKGGTKVVVTYPFLFKSTN